MGAVAPYYTAIMDAQELADDAGVPILDLTDEGAAVVLAESGATAPELCAIFGWSKLETAEIYIRAAQKKTMSRNAFARLDEYRARKSVSVLGAKKPNETKRPKSDGKSNGK